MNVERALRAVAGGVVIVSAALTCFHSPLWILFTLFVGANLLQSSLTNWCPMMTVLRKAGLKDCTDNTALDVAR